MDCPLLLIHFNRPDATARQIEVLAASRPGRVWVLCDGPREGRPGEAERVAEVRRQFESLPWSCEVRRIYREENLGVAANISSGITTFLDACGEGCILEDDCLPSASFLPFCAEVLERYRNDERVFAVSGHSGRMEMDTGDASLLFSNYFSCWGWATWRRAWNLYDPGLEAFKDPEQWSGICRRIFPGVRQRLYWRRIFGRVLSGQTDSWAYRHQLAQWASGGLVAYPARNLVRNSGFSGQATNTAGLKQRDVSSAEVEFPLKYPAGVEADRAYDRWIEDHWHSKSLPVRFRWLLEKIEHRLGG